MIYSEVHSGIYLAHSRRRFAEWIKVALVGVFFLLDGNAYGASPELVALGKQLFTNEFAPTPLGLNGDGLGPVFNHVSCVACHRLGGVGGAGDHRFNARTFSIQSLVVKQPIGGESVVLALGTLLPGVISSDDQVKNTFAVHRRGGSPEYDRVRKQTMVTFNPAWADDRMVSSDTVHAEAEPRTFGDATGSVVVTAHVFARNTTALFGAGLIDLVPESVILQQVKAQQPHPEIHGRPAILVDGRIGRFGWRANFANLIEFTENACVNELGLQSKSVPQPKDRMQPSYENTRVDIDNHSIMAMSSFIAALPPPVRRPAIEQEHAMEVALGEKRFNTIGCAVCHVPDLGPASGLYSDLLLHDMGPALQDYNTAPPYRKETTIQYEQVAAVSAIRSTNSYSGQSTAFSLASPGRNPVREVRFEMPTRSSRTVREPVKIDRDDVIVKTIAIPGQPHTPEVASKVVLQRMATSTVIPTNITQEWRTAPLWGLSDSAPYMHDGRAESILEAIAMHDGESQRTRNRFFSLPFEEQQAMLAFLDTLIAPQSGVIPVEKDFTMRGSSGELRRE